MSAWQVNLVTAFGRGETLALALKEHGFDVHVFDFTQSFPDEYARGPGPFPILTKASIPQQQQSLKVVKPLSNGLVFWLRSGPLELGGPLQAHFAEKNEAVKNLKAGVTGAEFASDWLRRFMMQWTSPFHFESWETPRLEAFPFADSLGLWPIEEQLEPSFARFSKIGNYVRASKIVDVQIERSRLTEFEIVAGQARAVRAPQWIWCLSSLETKRLNAVAAASLFNREVRKPEWHWMSIVGRTERGPWTLGFPEFSIVLNDEALPWAYGNLILLRWLNEENLKAWIKVPAASVGDPTVRLQWIKSVEENLSARLPQAKWSFQEDGWTLCPHAQVLEAKVREWRQPGWRNWDWIAPETLPRLDWAARLKRESESLQRLIQWRNEMIKKQGAKSDPALHAP